MIYAVLPLFLLSALRWTRSLSLSGSRESSTTHNTVCVPVPHRRTKEGHGLDDTTLFTLTVPHYFLSSSASPAVGGIRKTLLTATAMGQQQSNQNGKRRRRSTALAAGFVTGSSGKVEEKYCIDVSTACDQSGDEIFPHTHHDAAACVLQCDRTAVARQPDSKELLWPFFAVQHAWNDAQQGVLLSVADRGVNPPTDKFIARAAAPQAGRLPSS